MTRSLMIFSSSKNIIRLLKSRRMRWRVMWHSCGRGQMHIGFHLEVLKERENLVNLGINAIIISKWIRKKYDGMVWNGFVCLRTRRISVLL
jgi:hypothetical protein